MRCAAHALPHSKARRAGQPGPQPRPEERMARQRRLPRFAPDVPMRDKIDEILSLTSAFSRPLRARKASASASHSIAHFGQARATSSPRARVFYAGGASPSTKNITPLRLQVYRTPAAPSPRMGDAAATLRQARQHEADAARDMQEGAIFSPPISMRLRRAVRVAETRAPFPSLMITH